MRPALALGLLAALAAGPLRGQEDPGLELFEKKILPVLEQKCFSCHSAKAEKLKGNLHLDRRDGLLRGGDLGPAAVPGDSEKSLLVRALRYSDEDLKMPPKGRLPREVVADFEAWVRAGAPYPAAKAAEAKEGAIDVAAARKLWAYRAPAAPPLPEVRLKEWPANEIDRFILAGLEAKGLAPAPPADPRTLLRRVTFDLIGLPPAPEEVEAFLADGSPEAFAKVVDRLLASPRYGERWGRHWLDVARYTDSFDSRGMGGEADVPEAWRYRDWVVDAFNRDLPYDEFVRLQVAGDLLPGPAGFSAEGIVATGVMALGNWPVGDADKEKMITDIVDDQIDLVGRAFLGLTLACARCHDHKFDPDSTEDYTGLAGIFFSSRILPGPGAKTAGSPVLRIPLAPPAEVDARRRREAEIAALEKRVEQAANDAYVALARALLPRAAELLRAAKGKAKAPEGLELPLKGWVDYLGTGDLGLMTFPVRDVRGVKGIHAWKNARDADTPNALASTNEATVEFGTIKMPPKSVAIHPSPGAGVAVAWRSPIAGAVRVRGRVVDADAVCGDGVDWTLSHAEVELARGAFGNGGSQAVPEKALDVRAGDLVQLAVLPKREYTCDTTMVELEIEERDGARRAWNLARDVVPDFLEDGRGNPHADSHGNEDVWCFIDLARRPKSGGQPPDSALARFLAGGDAEEVGKALLAADAEFQELLKKPAGKEPPRLKGPNARLYNDLTDPKGPFWAGLKKDDAPLPTEARAELARMRRELAELRRALPPPIPQGHGLQEGGTPNSPYAGIGDARIHIRGRYDRLGPSVPRRFPRVLAGDAPAGALQGSGRLELARWLSSPENPLLARVMANRLWQHHFGEGIVRTPNNYGKLGIPPTHPELLDHLAVEFVKSGWSVKAMHRKILLSAAYRQSSAPPAATLQADPGNLLFGRQNRRRLEAEALRDSLLAAAGRLDPKRGGRAVADLANPRRTIYLATVRSDRNNFRSLFDAADPAAIVERRTEATVAAQALFLLNHPFALAQAKALAERAAGRPGDDRAKLDWLYALLYARPPVDREVELALAALARGGWEPLVQVLLMANGFMYVD